MTRVLVVRVGEERVAFAIDAVREVIDAPLLLPAPLAPEAVRGQLALRGQHLPVLDLGVLLRIPRATQAASAVLVMATGGFALAVDDAVDLWDAGDATPRPLPGGDARHGVLRSVLQRGDVLAALVDETALASVAVATLREVSSR